MSNNNGQKLAGKVAVVTGGSRGIGVAIAKLLKDNVALTLEARYLHLSCVTSARPILV
jgi:short-subunit dehydrogenase